MNKKQIEAYNYYKSLSPGALVLFQIGTNYVALSDDAAKVAQALGNKCDSTEEMSVFPASDVSLISELADSGKELKIVTYRNDAGELDYPDVERLKQEEKEDY
jgi:DNA mismatch repair ATPase MutS